MNQKQFIEKAHLIIDSNEKNWPVYVNEEKIVIKCPKHPNNNSSKTIRK